MKVEPGFVELLAQSNFTFLTGASHPEELVEESLRLGHRGLAIADGNTVAGLVRGFERWKALQTPSFRYLVGSLIDLGDEGQVTLLAENRKGYGKITQWITQWIQQQERSQSQGQLFGIESFFEFWSQESSEGVICVPRRWQEDSWAALSEVFTGQLYLPLVRYLDGKDRERHQTQMTRAKRYQLPVVASNDVYYHQRERKRLQDVLLSIRENRSLDDMGFRLFPNAERCLKSPIEMQRLFGDLPGALSETIAVAERCEFQLSDLRYYYPSEWIPSTLTAQQYLEQLVWEGAQKRYKGLIPDDVSRQIRHELGLIEQVRFADYFLTIYDIVEYAREQKILCQGRGSAANSVVCYVLGITAIDPVKMNLLFERFISVERGEPPDIDVDFEHERREEVIQYIYKKYGRHRAAMVCTHVCFRRRSALREVAKAFGVPVGTLSARQLEREWTERVPDPAMREKIEIVCNEIRGFPRHASIHTGGFTLSADAITRIVPVVPARMEARTVIQWDKNDLETLGLLKVDILSLGMLSALRKTLDAVGMSLYDLPHEDPKTYAMMQRADTVGTFQVESRAQMSMLGRLQPKTFYDMVIQVAIVRPGPIVGRMVHPYLRRRRGWEKATYPHPKLEKILGRTLGVPLFQEQVMKLAIELAGFSPGEADQLRRAIGAWRSSGPLEGISQRLMQGLEKSGLPEVWIQQVFEHIKGFSEYGFPESHAASFGLLAYASCYLKCHYPAEFLCALINSQPMGFYRVDSLIYDGFRHGIKVLPVHIQHSRWDCFIDDTGAIRLGFRLIRGFGKKEYERLQTERARAPFKSAKDFLLRTQLRESVLKRLVMAGRLGDARSVLWALMAYSVEDTAAGKQRSLFEWEGEGLGDAASLNKPELLEPLHSQRHEDQRQWDPVESFEHLVNEYEALGYSTKGHPMQILRKKMRLPRWTSAKIRQEPSNTLIEVAGMVLIRQKPPTAGGVVFATMEDEQGFIDLCFSPEIYTEFRETILTACFLWVSGKTQRDLNTVSIKVQKLKAVSLDFATEDSASDTSSGRLFEPTQYF
ncbi:MAG: polymerase alpha subunit [Pseudomonadota bacterium]